MDVNREWLELKGISGCDNIASIGLYYEKIMELIQLGTFDNGSVSVNSKYISLYLRWFRSKPSNGSEYNEKKCRKLIIFILIAPVLLQWNVNFSRSGGRRQ